MNKRIALILFICLSLVGCSRSESVLDRDIPTEVTEVETQEKQEKTEEVELTSEKLNNIKKYLQDNTSITFKEEVRSGVYDENVDNIYTVQYYNVIADTKSKVTFVSVSDKILSSNLGSYMGTSYKEAYVSDLKKDEYYSSAEVDKWDKDTENTKVINWDLMNYKNDYDIYEFLSENFSIKEKDTGVKNGDYEIYKKTTEATNDMLKNVDYDTIGDCISTLKIKDELPVSIETKVTFKKNNEEYYSAVKIVFEEYSTNKVTLKTLGIEE